MATPTGTVNEATEPRIPAEDARRALGELLDRVTDGERIVITRHDRDRVAIVTMRDLERLRALDSGVAA